jgi:hypothetical protein
LRRERDGVRARDRAVAERPGGKATLDKLFEFDDPARPQGVVLPLRRHDTVDTFAYD